MKRTGPRLLLALTSALFVLACGGSGDGTIDTGLLAGDFVEIVSGGIDDPSQSYPWAMALFDGDGDETPEVYLGTLGNALCIQAGVIALPPERWGCPNGLWSEDDIRPFVQGSVVAPVIYRGRWNEATQGFTWDRVFEPTVAEAFGFRGAIVYDGALYMLGGARLGTVWKSVEGENWAPASPPGLGVAGGFRGAVDFGGTLYLASDSVPLIYASTAPSTDPTSWQAACSPGFVASGGGTHVEIEATGGVGSATAQSLTSPDVPLPGLVTLAVGNWRVRITAGAAAGQDLPIVAHDENTVYVQQGAEGTPFGVVPAAGDTFEIYDPAFPDHGPSWTLAVHDGYLWASTTNFETGGPVLWRSANPAPGNWERVFDQGWFRPGKSVYATMTTFGSDLYLGSLSYPLYYTAGLADAEPCELLRLRADDSVQLLVGDERPAGTPGTDGGLPLSGLEAGFGQYTNLYVWRGHAHTDGWLYFGTCDFAQMVRDYRDAGSDLIPPDLADLIDLVVGPSGFDLYRTQDGATFTRVTNNGFGNSDSYGVRTFLDTPWGLLLGVANAVDGFSLYLGRK